MFQKKKKKSIGAKERKNPCFSALDKAAASLVLTGGLLCMFTDPEVLTHCGNLSRIRHSEMLVQQLFCVL